ncbi:MAG: hypothetical protein BWY18_00610 [Candidatus Cloacimonetes bacterium ADurb.Bin211]|nr:MAG: hypothetical protein BWY18_00610 [Candidatus Cloacimonetes bacterium ADurb.Bin211]
MFVYEALKMLYYSLPYNCYIISMTLKKPYGFVRRRRLTPL